MSEAPRLTGPVLRLREGESIQIGHASVLVTRIAQLSVALKIRAMGEERIVHIGVDGSPKSARNTVDPPG